MNVYNSMLHDLHHLRLAFATKSDEKKKKRLFRMIVAHMSFFHGWGT